MISADFAPNENRNDAFLSLITLFMPWTWKKGDTAEKVRDILRSYFPDTESVLFLSGRSTLTHTLAALKLPHGSEIIVAGFTCEAVILPILHSHCRPVYADIERDTFSLDIDACQKTISGKTRVIILQHSFGLVPRYRDRVLQLAKEKNIVIIEDLAHGFEPEFWQTQRLSDKQLLLLSFGRSKALSSVFGGGVIGANREIMAKIRKTEANLPYPSSLFIAKLLCYKPLSWISKKTYNLFHLGKILHFIFKNTGLLIAEISKNERRGLYDPYLDKKYPNALAKLLISQLARYKETIGKRAAVSRVYRKIYPLKSASTPGRYPILVSDRELILNDVKKKGVYLGRWYTQPVAPKPLSLASVGYITKSCPTAEEICSKIINLPTLVTIREAERITEMLKKSL